MTPFKHINRYKIRDAMPTILTATACIGVVATGVSSAMAMKQYKRSDQIGCYTHTDRSRNNCFFYICQKS